MEEKNVLELVELNKKLFSIQGIKKSVEEAIEKHKNTQKNLLAFLITLKLEKIIMGLFKKIAKGHPSNEISELYNTTEVLLDKVDERLFLLEKIEIFLMAMQRDEDNQNKERLFKTLSLLYTLILFVDMENDHNTMLYQNQIQALRNKESYIPEQEDMDKKISLENDINEIRRILNNE